MLDIVVGAIREAPGTTPVVVSPDSALDHRARRLGARFLRQHGIGLNQALEEARECLRADGYRRIAVMHGDLPFVTAADVAALVTSLPEVGVSIAPDLAGSGTNALCLRADDQLRFCFGADSYRRFHDEAAAIGATVTSVERNGLAFDLDSVDALRIFRRAQRSTAPLMEVG
jgi:2-phospho-L-lactate guanylyltransferase